MQKTIDYIRESLAVITSKKYHSKQFLTEVYILLSQYFPIDMMYLSLLDTKVSTLNVKAIVINRKAMLGNEVFTLSQEAMKTLEGLASQRILLNNNSNQYAPVKEIANQFNFKATLSIITTVMPVNAGRYSGLAFTAYGKNRYQPEHVALIDNLNESLAEIVAQLLARVETDCRAENALSSIVEVTNSLEHQHIDLTLNSQYGLRAVVNQVEQVGPLMSPALITGETGVGKELIARLLHGISSRAEGSFVAVNCGALPESLLDSELFGFEKGAFTGAVKKKAGYFEQADNGTLFLDEVGELPLQAQTKLLRVLQHQTFHRVGGTQPVSINVRVIAATNRDIPGMIKAQAFREDLWYRLNVFPIEVPPLRDRKDDIPVLVQYLINRKLFEMNLPFEPDLGPEAMDQLMNYDWPGNVRELQNVLERALILCKGAPLTFPGLTSRPNEIQQEKYPAAFNKGDFLSMEQMMVRHIHQSLKLSKGKIDGPGGAAELLKMHPSTLRARMKKLNIKISKVTLASDSN